MKPTDAGCWAAWTWAEDDTGRMNLDMVSDLAPALLRLAVVRPDEVRAELERHDPDAVFYDRRTVAALGALAYGRSPLEVARSNRCPKIARVVVWALLMPPTPTRGASSLVAALLRERAAIDEEADMLAEEWAAAGRAFAPW